jgi:hypothetical protein
VPRWFAAGPSLRSAAARTQRQPRRSLQARARAAARAMVCAQLGQQGEQIQLPVSTSCRLQRW